MVPLVIGILIGAEVIGSVIWAQDALEDEPEIATKEEVRSLLRSFESAVESKDASRVLAVVTSMTPFRNQEFIEPAKAAVEYKASKTDRANARKEADELGLRDNKNIREILLLRIADVQAMGARLLANYKDGSVNKYLLKKLKNKKLLKERPKVTAALIDALGRIDEKRAEKFVEDQFRKLGEPSITRACIRYFGQVKTKNFKTVRALCNQLNPPRPANPDAASNPPASYWAARWKSWNVYRRDVTWALREITGQTFLPEEGQMKSDAKKALSYIDAHKSQLGLK